MPEKKASPVSAIGVPSKVIDLPEEGPAGVISIEIRKVHAAELLTRLGDMPTFAVGDGAEKGIAAVARVMAKSKAPIAAVAEAVIVSPPFSFGEAPEDGKAWWGNLSWPNQLAVFTEGMAYAGLRSEVKEGTDADVARKVARFPGDKSGAKVRRAARGARKAAAGGSAAHARPVA